MPENRTSSTNNSGGANATATTSSSRTTMQNMIPLFKTPHLYWFLGHFMALIFFINYTILSFIARPKTILTYYNWCLNLVILTYLIVIRLTYQNRTVINLFITNYLTLLRDDNFQYLSLALLLRFTSIYPGPMTTALYPFMIFSLFHSLNYIKNYIIPNVAFITTQTKQNYINLINNFVTNYNEQSLYAASSFEAMLSVSVAINLIKLIFLFEWIRINPIKVSKKLMTQFGIIIFIKLRFNQSKYMKQIISSYDLRIQQFIQSSPYLPANYSSQLFMLYNNVKMMIIHYLGPIKIPKPQNIRKE